MLESLHPWIRVSCVLFRLRRWPLCLMTTAFKRDQNQRLKFTAHHPLASFIPCLPTLLVAVLWVMKTLQILSGASMFRSLRERQKDCEIRLDGRVREGWRAGRWSWAGGPMHTELRAAMIWGWREDKKKKWGAELITHISIGLSLRWPLHTSADTPGIRMNLEFSVHRAGQGWTRLPSSLQYRIQSHACHFLG